MDEETAIDLLRTVPRTLWGYVAANTVGFVVVAISTRAGPWASRLGDGAVALSITLVFLLFLLRGARWAWWLALITEVALYPLIVFMRRPWTWYRVSGLVLSIVEVALLLSRPTRRYVGIGRTARASAG